MTHQLDTEKLAREAGMDDNDIPGLWVCDEESIKKFAELVLRAADKQKKPNELQSRPCDQCSGTMRPDSNGYNTFLRCDKCGAVPMVSALAAGVR